MTKLRLLSTALAVAAATAACSRSDVSREAREATVEVRSAARQAGERLTDGWLTAKVQAKFFADEDVKARYIDVSSQDGIVTLKGFVENEDVRQEALRIARSTDGVTRVEDQLLLGQAPQTASAQPPTGTSAAPMPQLVGTSGSSESTTSTSAAGLDDSTVTSLIQAKYYLDPHVKARSIDVSSTNGVVTLRGQVASDNERAQALLLARTTQGVQRVEDSLTIDASLSQPTGGAAPGSASLPSSSIAGAGTAAPSAPSASRSTAVGTSGARSADATVESALRSKLHGNAQLKGIEISARDGVVLLQGSVANQTAKQRALSLVRETEGVTQVVDRLTIKRR
jgi:hyperosmotically inducible protein